MGTVAFDVARSTATGIPRATRENKVWPYDGDKDGLLINQDDPGWIAFDYMECNSKAFEPGDRVLVEFRGQDWAAPMIIGFESHPKRCSWDYYLGYRLREIPGSFSCRSTVMTTCAAISALPGGVVTLANSDWVVDLPTGRHYLYTMAGYIRLPVCGDANIELQGKYWQYIDNLGRGTWQATVCDSVIMPNGLCQNASGLCSLEDGPSTRGPALPDQWVKPPKNMEYNGEEWTISVSGFLPALANRPPSCLMTRRAAA
jgi:hypothetical protein